MSGASVVSPYGSIATSTLGRRPADQPAKGSMLLDPSGSNRQNRDGVAVEPACGIPEKMRRRCSFADPLTSLSDAQSEL